MSNYIINIETRLTAEEDKAVTAFQVACDGASLTRDQAANILRNTANVGHVHVGGGHVAICRGWKRVALIISNHPDWN